MQRDDFDVGIYCKMITIIRLVNMSIISPYIVIVLCVYGENV